MEKKLTTADDLLTEMYGDRTTLPRKKFEAKSQVVFLCAILKELRERKDLSQKQLAELVGCNQAAISHIESGERDVQLSSFIRILNALECKLTIPEFENLPYNVPE